jgi:L-alanine-DL-glutamate epimerase-like enolase superfamily enzyme
MREITRRALLAVGASATLLDRVRALAESVKPVRIREVNSFRLKIPVSKDEMATSETIGWGPEDWHRSALGVVQVVTDAGVNGYSFYAAFGSEALPKIREVFVGKDLFAIEQHLARGLGRWAGVEHAMWDAIGKLARQPVYKLLGGTSSSVKPYLTCVWKQPLTEVR